MSIFEGAFLFRLAPENFVVAVRVERRVDVNQIDARVRQLAKLIEIIAAIDDACVNESRGLRWHARFSKRTAAWSTLRRVWSVKQRVLRAFQRNGYRGNQCWFFVS